jgi:MOSC domain-containing protein YiiM
MKGRLSPGVVVAVSPSAVHKFSKPIPKSIRLLVGLGVEGDAHLGEAVQHRSRVAKEPTKPDSRQVHLVHEELLDELRTDGFQVAPEVIGENITTRGIDLLALPQGARLHIGDAAIVGATGLRTPAGN